MFNKVLLKNMVALILVQFSNYIAPLLVLPYLSRVLGTDGFGMIMMSLSLCSIGFIITDYGFNLSASYWIAKQSQNRDKVSRYIGSVYIIKSILIFFFIIGLIIYSTTSNSLLATQYNLIILIAFVVLFQSFQPMWFFQGIEKLKNVTIYMIVSKLSYLLLVWMLVKKETDISFVLISLCISNFFATVVSIFFIYKEGYKVAKPAWYLVKHVFHASSGFFLARAAVSVYTSASTLIVGSYAGLHQAAMYSSAEKLYMAGQSLSSPVSQALYPYLARTGNSRALLKIMSVLIPVFIIGCLAVSFISADVIRMFYGEGFGDSVRIFNVFLLSLIITFVSINFGYPAFAALGKLRWVNITVFIGGTLQILLLVILYYKNMITGLNVAICVLMTESTVLICRGILLYILKKRERKNVL
ncbi:oligosaccharide flippase family protein [Escherichia albertii]|uniref:oligosaccharide flippase family protein n=1 Tax=Escherichia albertii TaxID=208962 RepID=UPI0011323FD7|nr:oligosaccharide flippase family protein [Escherichia albertii]MCZ8595009.1 oligosaccharide flippase family protein [Escherichia albertii]WDB26161.1 oligosaccharide flippase family protein [Escherichia albertii]WDB53461.1 oligosaccharide flippase family protein [Escherichia albertii]